jgi:pyridoxine 5-phosphate synthase
MTTMTRLSVNINKIGTIRNSRGGSIPSVVEAAVKCQEFGAQGITIHPRPDERHIKKSDVFEIKPYITTEFNIEGYPSKDFIDLVIKAAPDQVTLVPDSPDALTSHSGWDAMKNRSFLGEVVSEFNKHGIRTSVFVGTDLKNIELVKEIGAARIELYTEPYAMMFPENKEKALEPFLKAAQKAIEVGLGLNAGHDLNLANLKYFSDNIPGLLEVSIGHAIISDAIYQGLENTIHLYLQQLK